MLLLINYRYRVNHHTTDKDVIKTNSHHTIYTKSLTKTHVIMRSHRLLIQGALAHRSKQADYEPYPKGIRVKKLRIYLRLQLSLPIYVNAKCCKRDLMRHMPIVRRNSLAEWSLIFNNGIGALSQPCKVDIRLVGYSYWYQFNASVFLTHVF